MHPTPPEPGLKVADTTAPAHTAGRSGVLTLSDGTVGCGFIFHDESVTQLVPVHPDPVVQSDLLPCISTSE